MRFGISAFGLRQPFINPRLVSATNVVNTKCALVVSNAAMSTQILKPKLKRTLWSKTRRALFFTTAALLVTGGTTYAVETYKNLQEPEEDRFPVLTELWFCNMRGVSRIIGTLFHAELPRWLRSPLYRGYSWVYGVNLDEAELPVEEYKSLGDFFMRRLKRNARRLPSRQQIVQKFSTELPQDQTIGEIMVSPVDGRVAQFGKVDDSNSLVQAKGITYPVDVFLHSSEMAKHKNLYYCVMYLAPGDYHRFHSPAKWSCSERIHVHGTLFPVMPLATLHIKRLFLLNERVVLSGQWPHGFFSMTAVGSTNVGSILINFDKDHRTNRDIPREERTAFYKENGLPLGIPREYYWGPWHTKQFPEKPTMLQGQELGMFKIGSTIVLVFESPEFAFNVKEGDRVFVGQHIGHSIVPKQANSVSVLPEASPKSKSWVDWLLRR